MGHVFISYARVDRAWADLVDAGLRSQGIEVWRDTRQLPEKSDFSAAIEAALRDASHVIVCLTAGSVQPDSWTRREVHYALLLADPRFFEGRGAPDIVPILFPGGLPIVALATRTFLRLNDASKAPALISELVARVRGPRLPTVESPDSPRVHYLRDLYAWLAKQLPQTEAQIIPVRVSSDVPTVTNVIEAYERSTTRLVVLGMPGSGKTTALLLLARRLALAALEDSKAPLPIFARLQSWDPRASFEDWVSEQAPPGLSGQELMYLFDGLDEVGGAGHRERDQDPRTIVVEALTANQHWRYVLGCRKREYATLGVNPGLGATVTLDPVRRDELNAYLDRLHVAREAATRAEGFEELLSTPLGARLVVETSSEGSGNLFDAWIRARLKRERERGLVRLETARIIKALEGLALREVLAGKRTRRYWQGRVPTLDEAALSSAEAAEILVRTREGERSFFHAALFEGLALPAVARMIDEVDKARAVQLGECIQIVFGVRGADLLARLIVEKFGSEERKSTFLHSNDLDDPRFLPIFLALYANNTAATAGWEGAILRLDQRAIPGLRAALLGQERLSPTAASILPKLGRPGMDVLVAALADPRPYVRRAVLAHAGPLCLEVADFETCLDDPDPTVRSAAICALQCWAPGERVDAILRAAEDPALEVRVSAYAALVEIPTAEATAALARGFSESNDELRGAAAEALVLRGDHDLVEPYLLHSTARQVFAAATALPRASRKLPAAWVVKVMNEAEAPIVREYAAFALKGRVEALDALSDKLDGDDSEFIRVAAARSLADSSEERAIPALARALTSDDAAGQWAAQLLVAMKDQKGLPVILEAAAKGSLVSAAGELNAAGRYLRTWSTADRTTAAHDLLKRLDELA